MLKVMVNGCTGKMGQIVCDLVDKSDDLILISGFSKKAYSEFSFTIFCKTEDISIKPDVIIDFSVPISTMNILNYAKQNNIPIVIATTGFSKDEEILIKEYSEQIPIFKSANMSYDIMIMKKLVQLVAPLLKNADIEITETHHNRKIDSPS